MSCALNVSVLVGHGPFSFSTYIVSMYYSKQASPFHVDIHLQARLIKSLQVLLSIYDTTVDMYVCYGALDGGVQYLIGDFN